MSQHGFLSLAASARTGGDLTQILEAIQSGHIGGSRPAYAVQGMIWCKAVGAAILVYLYNGSADVLIGSVEDGEFTPAGSSGGVVTLAEVETAGASAVDFTEFDPAIYDSYKFIFRGVIPVGDNRSIQIQIGDDAGVFASLASLDFISWQNSNGSISGSASATSPTSSLGLLSTIGTAAGERGVVGSVDLYDMGGAGITSGQSILGAHTGNTGTPIGQSTTFWAEAPGVNDCVRFIFTGSNFESGKITLQGVVKNVV